MLQRNHRGTPDSAALPVMRVLLINPPNSGRSIPEEEYGIDAIKPIFRGEPLGLEALAGVLPEHEVRIFDMKSTADPVVDEVNTFAPDIVGITGMTCEANTMLKIAREIRSISRARIVVGGIHASNDPEFFNREEIDFIVIGLGKRSFRDLVKLLGDDSTSPVPDGIARTAPGRTLSFTPRQYGKADLDEDYPPRYDLVEKYRSKYLLSAVGAQFGMVVSAYGCPYRCNFCCIEPLTGGRYLTNEIASTVRDIKLLPDVNFIRLVDANSFGDPDHAMALCAALRESGINKQFMADARADTIVKHPEMMRAWKEIGLRSVIVGFENINNEGLEALNKGNTAYHNTEAIRILHEIGVSIVGDFIVSPDYDHTDFDLLEQYLADNIIDLPILTVLTPLPGTAVYYRMKDRITNHDLDYYTLTNAVMPTRLSEKEFYLRYANILQRTLHGAKL